MSVRARPQLGRGEFLNRFLGQASGHPHTPGEDLFVGCVIIAETNVGTWRRIVQGRKMIMEIALASGAQPRSRSLAEAAAYKLATFVEKELELTITG